MKIPFVFQICVALPFPPTTMSCFEDVPEDHARCCIAKDGATARRCNTYHERDCCKIGAYDGPRIAPHAQRIRLRQCPHGPCVLYVHTMAHLDLYFEVRPTAITSTHSLYAEAINEWFQSFSGDDFAKLDGSHLLRSTSVQEGEFLPPPTTELHDIDQNVTYSGPLHAGYVIRVKPLSVTLAPQPLGIHPSYIQRRRGRRIDPSCPSIAPSNKDSSNHLNVEYPDIYGQEIVTAVMLGCQVNDLHIMDRHATHEVRGVCLQIDEAHVARIETFRRDRPKFRNLKVMHKKWTPEETSDIFSDMDDLDVLSSTMNFFDGVLTQLALDYIRPRYILQFIGYVAPPPFRYKCNYSENAVVGYKIDYNFADISLSQAWDQLVPYGYRLFRFARGVTMWHLADQEESCVSVRGKTDEDCLCDTDNMVDELACYVLAPTYMVYPYVYMRDWLLRDVDEARELIRSNLTRNRYIAQREWNHTTFW